MAAVALSCAGSASAATVVYQYSGTGSFRDIGGNLPGAGTYRVSATSTETALFEVQYYFKDHWDIFLAPAPRPHSEYLEGNDYDNSYSTWLTGTSISWDIVVPETVRTFYNAGPDYYYAPEGTPLYREDRTEDPYWNISIFRDRGDTLPFDYTISVVQLSAVPEPATWAMMIIGFGAIGGILRGGRLRRREFA